MNINEKGVHHMVVRTRRSKKGEHRNIFMFFTRYHRAFSLFFMLISFSFFLFNHSSISAWHGHHGSTNEVFFACGALAENAYGMRIEIMVFLLCDV